MKRNIILLLFFIINLTLSSNTKLSLFEKYKNDLETLNNELIKNGVDEKWFFNNFFDDKFILYENIAALFNSMKEVKVDKKEWTWEEFKKYIAIDLKVEMGRKFISSNIEMLKRLKDKNGIDYEIPVAIIGVETNFGKRAHTGNYYAFCSFVSQYIFMNSRKEIAINQLTSLYKYSIKINKPVYYFIGSFAGACGYGQFIPSSLLNFFIDSNDIDQSTDIFTIEDTLFSIENYLVNNGGLNSQNLNDYSSLYKAIYSYNRSDTYVKSVIYIYNEIKN